MIRINFSGHPAPGFDLQPLVGINLSMERAEELGSEIRTALCSLPCREELLRGARAEVILPGMSCAAAVLLAEWHGQFGSFPTVRWAVRGDAGFEWPNDATIDLGDVRLRARTVR